MRIIRVGIKRVVALKRYHADEMSLKLFRDAEINLVIMDNHIEEYTNQSGNIKTKEADVSKDLAAEFKSLKEILIEEGKIQNIRGVEQA